MIKRVFSLRRGMYAVCSLSLVLTSGCIALHSPVTGTSSASTVAPTVSLSASEGARVVASNYAAFPVSGSCTSAAGTVTFTIGTTTVGTASCGAGGTFSATLNLTSIADGSQTVTATQTNTAGIAGTATLSLTFDVAACLGANINSYDTTYSMTNFASGSSDGSSPPLYYICNITQLSAVRDVLANTTQSRFVLRDHINGGGADLLAIGDAAAAGSFPAGASALSRDEFDGNSLRIYNVVLDGGLALYSLGLFSALDGYASIHDLTLQNFSVDPTFVGDGSGTEVGLLAGKAGGRASVANVTITNGAVAESGTAAGFASRGGLIGAVGENASGTTACAAGFGISNITINGITVTNTSVDRVAGVVGRIFSGANCPISSVSVSSAAITGRAQVGGVIGLDESIASHSGLRVSSGTIASSFVGSAYAGGVVGSITNNATYTSSSAAASISLGNSSQFGGGFVGGSSAGNMTRCSSSGSVTGGSQFVGGFAGRIRPTSTNMIYSEVAATGNVTAANAAANVGGFAGGIEAAGFDLTLSDAFAHGNASSTGGSSYVGGFVGRLDHAGGGDTITVSRVYASGAASGGANVNGWGPQIITTPGNLTTNDSFYDSTKNGASVRGSPLATSQMQSEANASTNYTNFNFTTTWIWNSSAGLPALRNL
jgi:hypothetical protein